jgi:hypothetical protein
VIRGFMGVAKVERWNFPGTALTTGPLASDEKVRHMAY